MNQTYIEIDFELKSVVQKVSSMGGFKIETMSRDSPSRGNDKNYGNPLGDDV